MPLVGRYIASPLRGRKRAGGRRQGPELPVDLPLGRRFPSAIWAGLERRAGA